jgi:DNA replication and repair protein RecF
MIILNVEIKNFRNINNIDWIPDKFHSFINGKNGEGKTNLLESLYVLFNLRPLRSGNDFKPLLKKGEEFFSIKAIIKNGKKEFELFFSWSNGEKRLLIDREKVKPKEFLKNNPVLFFSPDQASFLVESPEVRRRVLDKFIFTMDPSYFDLLSSYKGLLKRRNRVLKYQKDSLLLSSLDTIFAPLAFEVSQKRELMTKKLEPLFVEHWRNLKPENFELSIDYKKNMGEANSKEEFNNILKKREDSDFTTRSTYLGPHREDLIFTMDGAPSKHFISHGERKIASLAFILAFAEMYLQETNKKPLFLIDDISSELDNDTLKRVMNIIYKKKTQVIIAGVNSIKDMNGNTDNSQNNRWFIEKGELFKVKL